MNHDTNFVEQLLLFIVFDLLMSSPNASEGTRNITENKTNNGQNYFNLH